MLPYDEGLNTLLRRNAVLCILCVLCMLCVLFTWF